jgi:trehalose 6-phosphate phosphatase
VNVPPLPPGCALFLDLDGTLLEIAATPESVHPKRADCQLVARLQTACKGALAIISGRALVSIDEVMAPLKLPAAGQHGFERRDMQGRIHRPAFPVEAIRQASAGMRDFAARHAGLILEEKGYSVALHYRLAPQLADAAHAVVRDAAGRMGGGMEVQDGKMVAELKPAGRDKGVAITEFMREAPFAGRVPVYIGDDVTDEDGFRAVNALGGHSVKVGEGPTAARWRLRDPTAVRAWLQALLDKWGQSNISGAA